MVFDMPDMVASIFAAGSPGYMLKHRVCVLDKRANSSLIANLGAVKSRLVSGSRACEFDGSLSKEQTAIHGYVATRKLS